MSVAENDAARWCAAAPVGAETPAATAIWRLGPGGAGPPGGWRFALGPDGTLAPGAGALIGAAPAGADVVISDDVTQAAGGGALGLKPAFDPLLLERMDYAGRAVFFREGALGTAALEALEAGAPPASLIGPGHHVAHLPYPAAIFAAPAAATLKTPVSRTPLGPVAAIIPNRNSPHLIRAALTAILSENGVPAPVVVVIDNGSDDPETLALYEQYRGEPRVRIERRPAPFNFAAMVNRGAALAVAEFGEIAAFLLLNNDIEAPAPGWLRPMEETLAAPGVGIVGAKLLFPDRTIQHAGVIVGHGGVAGHDLKGAREDTPGLVGRMAAPHLREAVTAAAMLVRADLWRALDGFDARAFPVAFNDVDFCLRAGAEGWRVALDPRAVLIHHEGVSRRRPPSLSRFLAHRKERAALRRRHETVGRIDRFESPWRDPETLTPRFRMLKTLPPIRF